MKLIDADALIARLKKDPLFCLVEQYGITGVIEAEPAIDAVHVVRCGECKYLAPGGICETFADDMIEPSASDYCSYGERRSDDAGQ